MRVLSLSLLVVIIGALLGSIVGSYVDGDTAAIDGKCRDYQVHKNGSWTRQTCSPLEKYSKEQKKCLWWFQVDCTEEPQCTNDGGLLKNPYTCSSYYKCNGGKIEAQNCWWPFFFDGKSGCKFWGSCHEAEILEDEHVTEIDKYVDSCHGGESEPIANSCFWYKTCGPDGVFEQTHCSFGKYFNVASKSCEWFWNVSCDVSTCDGMPRTSPDSDGKFYYQCFDGVLMKKTCGRHQTFDAVRGRCVFNAKDKDVNIVQIPSSNMMAAREQEASGNLSEHRNKLILKAEDSHILKTVVARNISEDTVSSSSISMKRVIRAIVAAPCSSGRKKAALDCSEFLECKNGVWVSQTCPNGQLFSDNDCRPFWQVQCDPPVCVTGTKSVYKFDCTKYYLCNSNNVQELEECPKTWNYWSRHFNPSTGDCEFAWPWTKCPTQSSLLALLCKEGTVYNPQKKLCEVKSTKVKRSANKDGIIEINACINNDTKYDVIPGVCSTFMLCDNGNWIRRACPRGQFYHGKSGCSSESCPYDSVPGDCEAFKLTNGTTQRCNFGMRFDKKTKQCVDFALAECTEIECVGLDRKNHPTDCSKFLQCNNQQYEDEACGLFFNKFDVESRKCVFGWLWRSKSVKCRYNPAHCVEGTVTPVKGNCGAYLTCKDKTEQQASCFWPMKFDTKSSRCVLWGAECL